MPALPDLLEAVMRTCPALPIVMWTLLAAALLPLAARADEQNPKQKIQKHPPAQTQTAPAGKGKQQAPGEAGILEIQGMVIKILPPQHSLVIRTTTNDYQVFLTPKSVTARNGKVAEFKEIMPGDKVDSCRFTAKKVVEKLTLTSVGKAVSPNPATPATP
jgi:hypothetical protein